MTAVTPALTLHALQPSHPCLTVERALQLKGLAYERVDLAMGKHGDEIERIYGVGHRTVPGLTIGDEPIHGSVAILERIDTLSDENPLYPAPIAEAVHEAERWGDTELQDLGRRMPWGAMHFRPGALGTFGGVGALDPAGTDYAIKLTRATWKYHGITATLLAEDLQSLPEKLDRIDALAGDGTIGGEHANAADLQIGATLRVLLTIEDLHPLLVGRPGEQIARRWFPDYPGLVPAGAFPAGWVPGR